MSQSHSFKSINLLVLIMNSIHFSRNNPIQSNLRQNFPSRVRLMSFYVFVLVPKSCKSVNKLKCFAKRKGEEKALSRENVGDIQDIGRENLVKELKCDVPAEVVSQWMIRGQREHKNSEMREKERKELKHLSDVRIEKG